MLWCDYINAKEYRFTDPVQLVAGSVSFLSPPTTWLLLNKEYDVSVDPVLCTHT